MLQAIAGDDAHDVRSASGTTSKWFKIYVKEVVSSLFDYPRLSYTITLTSPPDTAYGLFVYTGTESVATCSSGLKQGSGVPQTVSDTWGDALGADDSTWITVEVRYLSGDACGPSDEWRLSVRGHTNP
ncbi:Hypothetical protein A7982_11636 [Minicystis rosea]|nr:Hypothetical protein A7982_11636 [Minicystis rosea]